MRSKRLTSIDRDLIGAQQALERAAAQARRLAEQTGTPFYVLKSGQVVDLNARRSREKLHASTRLMS